MIGFHIQNSPSRWPDAVQRLPAGAPVKLVFGVERAREAKAANPHCKTWYRWVGDQPLPASNFEAHARAWLNQFVDGTFRREAGNVDYIQEYNETFANSQDTEERRRWIALHTAMARVWYQEYRLEPELAHIRMILAETAVGNDIPVEVAAAAAQYNALLGYHPYIVCRRNGGALLSRLDETLRFDGPRASFRSGDSLYLMHISQDRPISAPKVAQMAAAPPAFVSPHDWRWYSGRWAAMDAAYVAAGIKVDWIFGEMGPVRDASADWSGHLDPHGGWKHQECLAGDIDAYQQVLDYWLVNTKATPAWREGRVRGGVLFTSGAPGSGADWGWFDLVQPHMNTIADFVRQSSTTPPPPPPPPPVQVTQPREPYNRRMRVLPQEATLEQFLMAVQDAYANRETVGFSYDDAGYGAPSANVAIRPLASTTAALYGIPAARQAEFRAWYAAHYPGTLVEFRPMPLDAPTAVPIVNIIDELPMHETLRYRERPLEAITTLTIHHTVSPPERAISSIAAYHVGSNGWPGIGYHFVIAADGTIYQTNHLTTKSYHAGSLNAPGDENYFSVGIALQGDFTRDAPPAVQIAACSGLVAYLRGIFATIEHVVGHKEMPGASTACPGATWPDWKTAVGATS